MFARLTLIRVMCFFSAVPEIFMQNHEPESTEVHFIHPLCVLMQRMNIHWYS